MNIIFASTLILSGGQVFLGLAAIAGSIYCGILAYKLHLNNQSEALKNEIIGEHSSDNNSPLLRKYESVDIHQHEKSIQLVGTITSVAVVLVVFAWTKASSPSVYNGNLADVEDMEIPIDPPVTVSTVALPPPPLPMCNFMVASPEEIIEAKKEKKKPKEGTESVKEGLAYGCDYPLPEPIEIEEVEALPEINDEEIIMTISDQMPRFPGCEELMGDDLLKKQCADSHLLRYIHENINYPAEISDVSFEGMVVVSFVVRKDGSISDIQILRDPGASCGKEVVRVIRSMNNLDKWTPGKQRGKPVNVRYNVPVRFELR